MEDEEEDGAVWVEEVCWPGLLMPDVDDVEEDDEELKLEWNEAGAGPWAGWRTGGAGGADAIDEAEVTRGPRLAESPTSFHPSRSRS